MIGVDIVSIARMAAIYKDISKRCFSLREIGEMESRIDGKKAEYSAGRWAGKEAFIKASGLKDAEFSDIEILDDPSGKPHLFYKGQEAGEISLAHDDYAVAFVQLKERL